MVSVAAVALNWLGLGESVNGGMRNDFRKDVKRRRERERTHWVLNSMSGLVLRKG